MESTVSPADLRPQHVQQAHAKIRASIHETPLLTSQTLDRIVSTPLPHEQKAPRLRLFFKCENFQKIGAFKARGATHAVINLMARHGEEELRRRGVITHSSGMYMYPLAGL